MTESFSHPFEKELPYLLRHNRVGLHEGTARIKSHGTANSPLAKIMKAINAEKSKLEVADTVFHAKFFVPCTGNCVILLTNDSNQQLSNNFGKDLVVDGDSSDGSFRMVCPEYYVKVSQELRDKSSWAVIQPCNFPVEIQYGEPRPCSRVVAQINNFDFPYGHNSCEGSTPTKQIRVKGAGRDIEFCWRPERIHLRQLLDSEQIRSTSLVSFAFEATPSDTRDGILKMVHNIAGLCGIVMQQHTGTPVVEFIDHLGKPITRLLFDVVESKFDDRCILPVMHLPEDGLSQLFRQCFDNYVQLRESDDWKTLPYVIAVLEDAPYLEQKYIALMCAIEMFIRNSLVEKNICTRANAKKKQLNTLVNAARGPLRWDIPTFYTARDYYYRLRTAVAHGNRMLEGTDSHSVRLEFEKWRLFLIRRLLIRLGYTGRVNCAHRGSASTSAVNDFSQDQNSWR